MHPNHERPIPDDLAIFRKVFFRFVVTDDNLPGGYRISSQAFKNTTDTIEMSVVLSDTHADCGLTPDQLLDAKYPKVAAFTAHDATQLQQEVKRLPDDETDRCDAHGGVIGAKPPEVMTAFLDCISIVAE
jgi:hypothetical protein